MSNSHAALLSKENTVWTQGVSAVMIMVMHFVMQLDGYPRFLNILGSVGVAAFLFVSGFGINESYKKNGLAGFWEKRFLRVILPCWIVFLFQLPFIESFSAQQFFHNIVFCDSDLWFIDLIIRCYLAYWVIRRFFPKHTTSLLLVFSLFLIFHKQLVCEQAFSFFAGYIVSQNYDRIKETNKGKVLKYSLLLVSYGMFFLILKEFPYFREIKGTLLFNIVLLNIKLPLAVSVIVMPFLFPWVKKIKVLNWYGGISYELYIVHYNFMPFVSGLSSVVLFGIYSTFIGFVFNKICNWLKENFLDCITAVLFVGVCYILMCKYSMRATDSFCYIVIPYIMILAIVLLLLKKGHIINRLKNEKIIFWSLLGAYLVCLLLVQYHFDPTTNRVDRWSAIAFPLDYLFEGKFPYDAPTHLGGNASPFPVWLVFHIPFWLLGNVGLSEIFSAAAFIYSVKLLKGYKAGIVATVLLGLSVNMWYETSVRSDLISNFLLLSAFINFLLYKRIDFSGHPYILAAVSGLWLSTRISVFFPLFILFFPSWLSLKSKEKICSVLIALAALCLTFLPLILWNADHLFYAENNPFSLQTRQGQPIDTLILAAVTIILSFLWKNEERKLLLFSALMLVSTIALAYGHNMYINDKWTLIFTAYDISYLDAALPFCITILSTINIRKKNSQQL